MCSWGKIEMNSLQVPSYSNSGYFDFDVLNEPPPLLGSPNSCGIWSPLRKKLHSPSTLSITSSESSVSETNQLITSPELNGIEDKVFLEVCYAFRRLQYRLDVLLVDVRKMREEADCLSHNFQKMLTNTEKKFRTLSKTRADIADKIYLDQLICLLNGDIQHLPTANWPFKMAKADSEPFDLVI